MLADLFDLGCLNGRDGARPQSRGFDDLGSHHQRWLDSGQAGSRVKGEPRAACTEVLAEH
jgi:hypothetical protein